MKKESLKRLYVIQLNGMLAVLIYLTVSMIWDVYDAKEVLKTPLPSYEELEHVDGIVEKFITSRASTKYGGKIAELYLNNGNIYYFSKRICSILDQTNFEEVVKKGDKVELWVSYQKTSALDGKVPAVYQLVRDGEVYLSYKVVFKETTDMREAETKLPLYCLGILYIIWIPYYVYSMVKYKKSGRLPKSYLKKMRSHEIYGEAGIRNETTNKAKQFVRMIADEELKEKPMSATKRIYVNIVFGILFFVIWGSIAFFSFRELDSSLRIALRIGLFLSLAITTLLYLILYYRKMIDKISLD